MCTNTIIIITMTEEVTGRKRQIIKVLQIFSIWGPAPTLLPLLLLLGLFFAFFFSVTPPTLQDSCKLIFWSSAAPQRYHRDYMKQHPAPAFCPSTDASSPAGARWPPLHAMLCRAVRGPLSVMVELQLHKSQSWCWRCVSAVVMWRFKKGLC